MIIPIRCLSCGKVLADKWEYYKKKCEEMKLEKNDPENPSESKHLIEPFKKNILDALGLDRYCCRRHMLTHVDIIDTL